MPLSWNEIRDRSVAFSKEWKDESSEDAEAKSFWDALVLVPRGYHPVAAVAGYDIYYLNVMAGPKRAWKFYNAPEHEWMIG